MASSSEFTMTELESHVNSQHTITPGSAGRILRELKRFGKVKYDLIDRYKSLYRVWQVAQ